ncbi:hypothetical protein C8Q77DRAFT_173606 [Trametes polyzona]|nr:hypothetical protein C8Q77DRAFT_173606 [Trametes polyzona]
MPLITTKAHPHSPLGVRCPPLSNPPRICPESVSCGDTPSGTRSTRLFALYLENVAPPFSLLSAGASRRRRAAKRTQCGRGAPRLELTHRCCGRGRIVDGQGLCAVCVSNRPLQICPLLCSSSRCQQFSLGNPRSSRMADISTSTSELIGLWLQLLMTGAYLVYFVQCSNILRRRMQSGMSYALPFACGVIFVLTCSDMVLALCRAHQAFTVDGQGSMDPETYYADASTPLCVTKNALETAMTIVSDIIIDVSHLGAQRASRSVPCRPPPGQHRAGCLVLKRADNPETILLASARVRYFFILTLCLNLFCGGMICWRIWTKSRRSATYRQTNCLTRRVLETILQTAAIHCAVLLVMVVLDFAKTNAMFIFLDLLTPLQAYVFSVLIVRANVYSYKPIGKRRNGTPNALEAGRVSGGRALQAPPRAYSAGVEIVLDRVGHPEDCVEGSGAYAKGRGKVCF